MESLRFPWGRDDEPHEVAPSVFRPRRSRSAARDPDARPPSRTQATKRRADEAGARVRGQAVRASSSAVAAPSARGRAFGGRGGVGARDRATDTERSVTADRNAARDLAAGQVLKGPQRERHEPDYVLLITAIALSAIGILMIYSSNGVASARDGAIFDAVTTQLGWGLLGVIALVVLMRLDYRYWRFFSVLGFAIAVGLLILVLLPAIPGLIEPIRVGGAARWLAIGGMPAFHPAEFAKLAVIIYLAHWLTTRGVDVGSLRRGLVPFLLIASLVIALVALEPDLGTTGVITLTVFTMFFVAGGSVLQLGLLIPPGVVAVGLYISNRSYQLERWETFLDPFAVADGPGYQTVQGIYALAIGGVTGIGLGESRQPGGLLLPNADNDFIFAVVGQELGLIGTSLVVLGFILLAWRGIRTAMGAPDGFGRFLAIGITSWLCFQAFINIGVVTNLLPLTGLPLPFLSDGGTSLVVSLAAVGILLSISRETVVRGSPAHEDPGRSRRHRRPHLSGPGRGEAALDASS